MRRVSSESSSNVKLLTLVLFSLSMLRNLSRYFLFIYAENCLSFVGGGKPLGAMAKVLDCNKVVNESKLQLCYYINFQINILVCVCVCALTRCRLGTTWIGFRRLSRTVFIQTVWIQFPFSKTSHQTNV